MRVDSDFYFWDAGRQKKKKNIKQRKKWNTAWSEQAGALGAVSRGHWRIPVFLGQIRL